LRVRAEYVGQRIACKYCSNQFKPEPPAGAVPITVQEGPGGDAEAAKQQLKTLQEEVLHLRAELVARTTRCANAEEQLKEVQQELARLQSQILELQGQFQLSQEHEQEVASLRLKLQSSLNELDQLRAGTERFHGEDSVNGQLEVQLQAVRAESAQLQAELQAERNRADSAQKDLERTDAARTQHAEEIQRLRSELASSLEHVGHLGIVTQELETARTQIAQSLAEAEKRWEEDRRALQDQAEHQNKTQFSDQQDRHAAELAAIGVEREQLQHALEALHQESEELRRSWEAERDELRRTEAGTRQQIETLERERDQIAGRCNDAESARLELEKHLKAELEDLRQREHAATQRHQDLTEELQRLQAEIVQERTQSQEEVGRLSRALAEQRDQETQIAQQAKESTLQSQKLQLEFEQIRRQHAEDLRTLATLQQELEAARAGVNTERDLWTRMLEEEKTKAASERLHLQLVVEELERQLVQERESIVNATELHNLETATLRQALRNMGIHV